MGRIFKFDKDVDTDQIIASQYLLFPTIDEMKSHTFESLDSDFASAVKPEISLLQMTTLDVVHQESRHQAYLRR